MATAAWGGQGQQVELKGKTLSLSNLGKVLYPQAGFTKGDVIRYYVGISPVLLPHLKNRPLTLKRYPNGVDGPYFYEKQCPAHRPSWVKTAAVPGEDRTIHYCLPNDLPTLVWAANLADLELHTPLHVARNTQRPTMVVFDLDPGAPAELVHCCRVAMKLQKLFDKLGLQSFAKTSGSKGLQLYVPLNTPVSYDETKAFSRALAEHLTREHPDDIVANMKKSLRPGKVLVDWSQNDEHKTTVCVYSLRAKAQPTVSSPVTWKEVRAVAEGKKPPGSLIFTAPQLLERVQKLGDLFAPLLTLKQKLG